MGASISSTFSLGSSSKGTSPPSNNEPTSTVEVQQTPKRKRGRPRKQQLATTIKIRQSRRTYKCAPSKVNFPTWPANTKTPSKLDPLTPQTRAHVEKKVKPILLVHRKSPRIVKHKIGSRTTTTTIPQVGKGKDGILKYTPNATYQIDEFIFVWNKKGYITEGKVIKLRNRDDNKYYVHFLEEKRDKWVKANDNMLKVDASSRRYFKESRGMLPFDE